jgi:hypothetical protein
MPITYLRKNMDKIAWIILKLLGIVCFALLIIVLFAGMTTFWRAVLVLGMLAVILWTIMLISWLSIWSINFLIDFRLSFRRAIKPRLTTVLGNKHRLSNAELRGSVKFLRNNLKNLWNFDTPIDITKLEDGLTLITNDTSHVSHYELHSIKMMLDRGRRRLRRVRFLLMVGIAFIFFLIGCATGILFVYWSDLMK